LSFDSGESTSFGHVAYQLCEREHQRVQSDRILHELQQEFIVIMNSQYTQTGNAASECSATVGSDPVDK
jgi:hypothetical protein